MGLYIPPDLLKYASPAELDAYEKALRLELALASPLDYACYVSPKTERTPHAEYVNNVVVGLINGTLINPRTGKPFRKCAISMPPRHGKSYLISEHVPAWFETRWPDRNSAVISYEAEFAKSWGRKARNHVEDYPEFGVVLSKDQKAADSWATTQGGMMFTAGRGGSITGKGIHIGIIDDLIKNNQEARSATIRDEAYDTIISTVYTRRESIAETPIILMATRWHEDDPIGRLTEEEPDEWFVINLAGLALDDDPLGRLPGEALWPDKFSRDDLLSFQKDNQYWFAAMYQGQPHIEGGGLFNRERFRYWGPANTGTYHALQDEAGKLEYIPVKECTRFMTMDVAATTKTSSDYSVIATWDATKDRRLILVALRRRKIETPDQLEWVKDAYKADRPKWISVENKTYGLALIQAIRASNVFGEYITVRPSEVDGDHFTRAIPAAELVASGRVYFPRFAEWLPAFERELEVFNNGTHDDQVDALSIAVHEVTQGVLHTAARNPRTEPATMQEKVDKLLDKLIRQKERDKRHPQHPILGKYR